MENIDNLFACTEDYLRANIKSFFSFDRRSSLDEIMTIDNNTIRISITGGLTNHEYNLYLDALALAEDDQITRVEMYVNSPGGVIGKADLVWQAVKVVSAMKPVIAYNTGIMASAAYWIASAATEIIAVSPTVMTGSLGVQYVEFDITKRMEALGLNEIVITSSNAKYKNVSAITDAGKSLVQQRVDAIERVLLSRVSEGRNIALDYVVNNYGQGDIFIAYDPERMSKDALNRGMIDTVQGKLFTEIDKGRQDMDYKTLQEYYDAFPNLEKLVEKAKVEAMEKATEDVRRSQAPVIALVKSEYPSNIKALLIGALEGTNTIDRAIGAVDAYDAIRASAAIESAVKVDKVNPPVMATSVPEVVLSNDGVVRTEADILAAGKSLRGLLGGI